MVRWAAALERDYGPSMVFRVGGIDIIVITNNGQAVDLGQFTSLGIDPTRYTTVVRQVDAAFPRRLRADRPRSHLVDTGALSTRNFKERPYKNPAAHMASGCHLNIAACWRETASRLTEETAWDASG